MLCIYILNSKRDRNSLMLFLKNPINGALGTNAVFAGHPLVQKYKRKYMYSSCSNSAVFTYTFSEEPSYWCVGHPWFP